MARALWRTAVGPVLALTLVGAAATGAQFAYAAEAPLPAGASIDQFDETSLAPGWSVLNGDATQWSLTERPGHLRIHSLKGDTWQTANDAKNVFLQDIPAGDFEAVAKFDAAVTLDYQSAGLLAWQDTDNYLRAGLAHVGAQGGAVIENALEIKAAYAAGFTARPGSASEILKISRTGKVFTTSYWDGSAWKQAAQVTAELDVRKVGVFAFSAQNGTAIAADFDYVAVAASAGQAVVPDSAFTLDDRASFLAANGKGEIAVAKERSKTQLVVRAVDAADGTIALQDQRSRDYVEVGPGKQLRLAAKSTSADQRFRLVDAGGGLVRWSGSTGYVAVKDGTLTATVSSVQAPKWHVRPYGSAEGQLTVDAGAAGKQISDRLHGVFFEDINQAADGGLYAELVRNRSFEFEPADKAGYNGLTGWDKVERGGATGATAIATADPLNDKNLHYLRLTAANAGSGDGAGVGIRNAGYNTGIAVKEGASYDISVWARTAAASGTALTVRVESPDGATVYGTASLAAGGNAWKKYSTTLNATGTTTTGRLVVVAGSSIDLDMVSLYPKDTFKGRPNGMRKDLAEVVAALKPKFFRFPGGCVVNTRSYDRFPARARTYQWKDTVGPVEQRPTNANFWGYNQTYGMGYFEYFQLAEDLGAKPLAVVPVGVTGCGDNHDITEALRAEYVQDTLDLIEFANGDASTTWGKLRAEMGHPEPFGLEYIGIGNEEYKPGFYTHFPHFANAVRAKYPNIKIVSNAGPHSEGDIFEKGWQFAREQKANLVDEHYYNSPDWFLTNDHRYDDYDRSGPKVFIGEYASKGNTYYNALAEAAFLTGVERNGDVVELASYAPLLATPTNVQWSPDMIWFDNHRVYGSANYYVQRMFSTNMGDRVLPSTYTVDETATDLTGKVGLATWNTQARYDDVKVTGKDGKALFSDEFSADAARWTPDAGTWSVQDGAYVQSSTATPAKSTAGETDWSNYTLEVKARKTGGAEGFLVAFGVKDTGNYYWWNLGGWGNTRSAIQKTVNGATSEIANSTTKIETGRDYQVKIEVRGRTIRTYLDGVKVNEIVDQAVKPLYQVTTKDTKTGDIVVKVVNARDAAVRSNVQVKGASVAASAAVTSLTADSLADVNSFTDPTKVAPVELTQTGFGAAFAYDFPGNSITFIRLKKHTEPEPSPSPSPSVEPSPSAKPSPSVEPSPSAKPSPSVEPSPSAKPSPSVEPSPSAKPSPSVEPSPSPTAAPGGDLPTTGQRVGSIAALGGLILAGGALLLLMARRRRTRLDSHE